MATGFDLFSVRGGGKRLQCSSRPQNSFNPIRLGVRLILSVAILGLFSTAGRQAMATPLETRPLQNAKAAEEALRPQNAMESKTAEAEQTATAPKQTEHESLSWLMQEPVTLMDIGMMRFRMDLSRAVLRMNSLGNTLAQGEFGAYFDWRQRKIIGYLSLPTKLDHRNGDVCRERFQQVLEILTERIPVTSNKARYYLMTTFSHEFGTWLNPKNMTDDLLKIVKLEVSLAGHPTDVRYAKDWTRIRCDGFLDAALDEVDVSMAQ